jgi:hypothetical protein
LRESHKAKSATAAGIAIFDYNGFLNGSEFLEFTAKSRIVGVPGEATNEDLGHNEVRWMRDEGNETGQRSAMESLEEES